MKIKFFYVLIGCFLATSVFSQSDINSYKYVIVPKKFDFLKEPNQYRLNELTQFLFNKYGFEAIIEGEEYPQDLLKNRCLALKSNVLKDSGLFKTKLNVEMKDCNDRVVFLSEVGESREKEYDKAFTEALRNAFISIDTLNYKYETNKAILSSKTPNATNSEVVSEIQQLKLEIESLKKENKVIAPQPEEEVAKTLQVEAERPKNPIKEQAISETIPAKGVLYAQDIENGFQLVDSTPKVVYKIMKTGANNVFLVENSKAIVYKEGDKWILENSENGNVARQELNIKF